MSTTISISQAARAMQRRSVQSRNAKAGQLSLFRYRNGQYVPCTLDPVFGEGGEAPRAHNPAGNRTRITIEARMV